MTRIVVASASESARGQLSGLLASSGYPVFRCCASATELRRALSECDDGVAVIMGPLSGCKVEELYWDHGERIRFLFIAKPLTLEDCETAEIFRLTLPTSGQAVVGAVGMLVQLHQMRMPRRAGEEKRLVERAKDILMARNAITEPEAHRLMQRYAMSHGIKMTDYALKIVKEDGG